MPDYMPISRRPIAAGFQRTAEGTTRFCVRHGIHPDAISYLSILAALAAAICFWKSGHTPWLLIVAPLFCYLRLWFNMLDGMVAVAANKASWRGVLLTDLPDRTARSNFPRVLLVRSNFPRDRRSDARIPASGLKKRHRVDVQNLLVMDLHGGDWFDCRFSGTHSNHRRRHLTRDLRFQGVRARFRIVPRLVDDRRSLRRNRYCRNFFGNFASARRRTRHRLVRFFCRGAGLRDRVDLVHSDFAQSRSWRTAADVARHRRIHLHRLDVRSPRISRQREQRLRLHLLHYFRDGAERRRGLHFRKNLRSPSVAERNQSQ